MTKKRKLLYATIVFVSALAFLVQFIFRIPVFIYPGFGIRIPAGYSLIGIDVSRYQGKINWQQVSEMKDFNKSISFAIMKATQGANSTDYRFNRNWRECKKYGIKRGAYLFFDPRQSGLDQANHYIETVRLQKGDFAPVIDIEELFEATPEQCRKEAMACAKKLETYYGIKPIIYSYSNFYKNNLEGYFDQYPLWIAHYKEFGKPNINRDWAIWQYSEKGHVNGIGSYVDFNVFNTQLIQPAAISIP